MPGEKPVPMDQLISSIQDTVIKQVEKVFNQKELAESERPVFQLTFEVIDITDDQITNQHKFGEIKESEIINNASAIKPALLKAIIDHIRELNTVTDDKELLNLEFEVPKENDFNFPKGQEKEKLTLKELINYALGPSLNTPIKMLKDYLLKMYLESKNTSKSLYSESDISNTFHKHTNLDAAVLEIIMNKLEDEIHNKHNVRGITLRDSTTNEQTADSRILDMLNLGNTSHFNELSKVNMDIFEWAINNWLVDPIANSFYNALQQIDPSNPTRGHELKGSIPSRVNTIVLGKSGLFYNQSKENIGHMNDFTMIVVNYDDRTRIYKIGWSLKVHLKSPTINSSKLTKEERETIDKQRESECQEYIDIINSTLVRELSQFIDR